MLSNNKHTHEAARAVATFLIVFIAVSVFLLFYQQKDFLMEGNDIQKFLLLTIAGFGALIFLGFLVNHPGSHKSAPKKKKK